MHYKKENENFIVDVWQENLYQEMANIRMLIKKYQYVSMDTEFPGVVAKPIGIFRTSTSFAYQQLRCNVNLLNLIQLGISISDEFGNRPEKTHIWQFNLFFDLQNSIYSKESIDLLKDANFDFAEHYEKGIDVNEFSRMLLTSGLVLSKKIHWVGFHCAYDFAYLIKLLTGNAMPEKESTFYEFLEILFPSFTDFKFLIRDSELVKKGLQEISQFMDIQRLGTAHQAGSDAYVTSSVFFKSIKTMYNEEFIKKNKNKLFGIEPE